MNIATAFKIAFNRNMAILPIKSDLVLQCLKSNNKNNHKYLYAKNNPKYDFDYTFVKIPDIIYNRIIQIVPANPVAYGIEHDIGIFCNNILECDFDNIINIQEWGQSIRKEYLDTEWPNIMMVYIQKDLLA